jgi:nicotinate-nucleotide adenylyltransferase
MSPTSPRRLGVYGGSFDPIHRGHLLPVEEMRVRLGLDVILFVVAFTPPHKPSGISASSHHRFAMTALALQDYRGLVLSDFEVARGGTTYTVETLRYVRAIYPGTEVFLVLGSDSFVQFHMWRSWREMAEDYRLVVLEREPFDYESTKRAVDPDLRSRLAPQGADVSSAAEGQTIFWGGNSPVTISSTWIRRAVQSGNDLQASLPPAVETYIRKEKLYLQP